VSGGLALVFVVLAGVGIAQHVRCSGRYSPITLDRLQALLVALCDGYLRLALYYVGAALLFAVCAAVGLFPLLRRRVAEPGSRLV
jgi:hypothetical protein